MSFAPFNVKCYEKLYPHFQYLFEEDLIHEFCKYGQTRTFKAGEILMDIGQLIKHMPLIISGSVKIMREDQEGKELLLYYLELGDTCAVTLNCCTRQTKSTIRATCEEDSEILFIGVEKMEEWMIAYKSWRNFVLESFNGRLNEMLEAIDQLAFHNMEERLYKYLKDKVMVSKSSDLHITHHQIAQELNSSRVVISRLMKKLETHGKILQSRNKVSLPEYQ
ncbi:MAG: Crp/Fnr family transcriptional regulator [Bacteroidota bacterium]